MLTKADKADYQKMVLTTVKHCKEAKAEPIECISVAMCMMSRWYIRHPNTTPQEVEDWMSKQKADLAAGKVPEGLEILFKEKLDIEKRKSENLN